MEKKRAFNTLQAVRAIAAMMVVLLHAATFVGLKQAQSAHSALENAFSPFRLGVEIFFVLSGFVIYTAHKEDINHGVARLKTYVWKRGRRIYPIYWFVLVPVLLSQMVRYEPLHPYHRNPLVILSSFLLVHIGSEVGTNLVVAWTLFHEVMFYLFFGLLLISKRAGIVLLAIWLVPSVFFWKPTATYWGTIFSPMHLLFLFGIAMAWCLPKKALWPVPSVLAGAVLFSIAVIRYAPADGIQSGTIQVLSGLGAALVMLGLVTLEVQGRLVVPRWLVFLGDASYAVYLVHFPVIAVLARAAFKIENPSAWVMALWLAGAFLAGVVAGCLLHIWVERPLLRWLQRGPLRAVHEST